MRHKPGRLAAPSDSLLNAGHAGSAGASCIYWKTVSTDRSCMQSQASSSQEMLQSTEHHALHLQASEGACQQPSA